MRTFSLILVVLIVSSVDAQIIVDAGNIQVRLDEFANGLGNDTMHRFPTDMVPIDDGSGRIVVSTQNGVVRLLDRDGNALDSLANPYLDTRDQPFRIAGWYRNFGMSGVAMHPDFARDGFAGYGKMYLIMNEQHHVSSNNTNIPDFLDTVPEFAAAHHDIIVEWATSDPSSNNPTWTRRDVVRMEQPAHTHNVTDLAFGPDGLLYFASGDGGGSQRLTLPQDATNYLGKMLRIDPLDPNATGIRSTSGSFINSVNGKYRIPTTNPGVGVPNELDEIYAFGLRSPYRIGFDSVTGDLMVGDVGESSLEEVSIVTNDGNYGWGAWEGTNHRDPSIVLAGIHTPPVFEYGRSDGQCILGGFVYRGSKFPELSGKYVFAELGRQVGAQAVSAARFLYGDLNTGEIFEFNLDPTGELLAELVDDQLTSRQFIFGLGQDTEGEIYLLVGDDPQFQGALNPDGRILRVNRPVVLGDANNDGGFDNLDISSFVQALTDPAAYAAAYPDVDPDVVLDMNGDGVFNNQDIAGFVAALTGGGTK